MKKTQPIIYKILQKKITQYKAGLKVTRKQQGRSTRVFVLISEFCVLSGEAAHTIYIIWFDLTEPMIYCTRGDNDDHLTIQYSVP